GLKRTGGEIDLTPAHLIDIMPTCVELAGATYGSSIAMAGVSLVPAFEGKAIVRDAPIFFEHEGNRAVRAGRWKLVAKGAQGSWELYDMGADRTEMHDLAADQPDRVKELAAVWQQWAQASHVLPLNPIG